MGKVNECKPSSTGIQDVKSFMTPTNLTYFSHLLKSTLQQTVAVYCLTMIYAYGIIVGCS